jgi:DNA-binding transcriptional LysR family regulator
MRDLQYLQYFIDVCKAGSIAAAARGGHAERTTVSHAVRRLEDGLGVTLFDREPGGRVTLTEEGAALLQKAPGVFSAVQAAEEAVAAAAGQVIGTVTLGSTLHTGRLHLAAVLSGIRGRYPGVAVHLRQHHAGSVGMLEAVRDGSLDIALTAAARPAHGVDMHRLFEEPMVFVCLPDHPLSRRDRVTAADLRDEKLVLPPPGWGSRAAIDAALGDRTAAFEVSSYQHMSEFVREGFGPTLVPASAMSGGMLAGLRTVPAEDERLRWVLSAAVSAERRMPAATKVLLEALIAGSPECAQEAASAVPGGRP